MSPRTICGSWVRKRVRESTTCEGRHVRTEGSTGRSHLLSVQPDIFQRVDCQDVDLCRGAARPEIALGAQLQRQAGAAARMSEQQMQGKAQ